MRLRREDGPLIRVGHRGAAALEPENTLRSFEAALAHGVDAIEFDEAFASNILVACSALKLDEERICRQGGAIAFGHPWGASGAILMTRLFTQLVRQDGGRFGLAAVSAGSGQGIAMVVERC